MHLLLILGLAAGGTLLLSALLLSGVNQVDFAIFLALLLFYATASISFLLSQTRSGYFPLFHIPVFLTVLCFIRCGLAPLTAFLDPESLDPYFHHGEYSQLNRTFFLFILGMLAFWAGCHLCRRKPKGTADAGSAPKEPASQVLLAWAVALFLVSLVTRVYVTNNYGYGYGLDLDLYFANLALLQVLMFLADLGTYALVIATIEMCYHPRSRFRKALFAVIFLNEVFWGALSGMKLSIFQVFIVVAAIISITRTRLDKKWIAAVLVGFVLIYPMHDRYRRLLRGGKVDVKRVGALEQAGGTAARETARQEKGWQGWIESGWHQTVRRFDLLQSMAVTTSLDRWQISRLQGDERWWMVPFYPFVPRFVWPSKPVLIRGLRMSVVLGAGEQTSTALTYPGDLYIDHGLAGVLIGMLALGMVGQLITNRIAEDVRKRDLFFYSSFLLFTVNDMETDAFSVWTTLIKWSVILTLMTYLFYGRRAQPSDERFSAETGAPRGCRPVARALSSTAP
jgi:hypothetical protein